jgi:hypothetical protein
LIIIIINKLFVEVQKKFLFFPGSEYAAVASLLILRFLMPPLAMPQEYFGVFQPF